jgi:hypothetical protein
VRLAPAGKLGCTMLVKDVSEYRTCHQGQEQEQALEVPGGRPQGWAELMALIHHITAGFHSSISAGLSRSFAASKHSIFHAGAGWGCCTSSARMAGPGLEIWSVRLKRVKQEQRRAYHSPAGSCQDPSVTTSLCRLARQLLRPLASIRALCRPRLRLHISCAGQQQGTLDKADWEWVAIRISYMSTAHVSRDMVRKQALSSLYTACLRKLHVPPRDRHHADAPRSSIISTRVDTLLQAHHQCQQPDGEGGLGHDTITPTNSCHWNGLHGWLVCRYTSYTL